MASKFESGLNNEPAHNRHEVTVAATLEYDKRWISLDPELQFNDGRLGELLDYWNGKRAGRAIPARRDIDPLELKSHLGRLHLIDVEYAPFRLRLRMMGVTSTETLGRDMTGRYFDKYHPPEILKNVLKTYEWLGERKRPLRHFGNAVYADKSLYAFEVVNLPLSDDDDQINMIFGEMVLSIE